MITITMHGVITAIKKLYKKWWYPNKYYYSYSLSQRIYKVFSITDRKHIVIMSFKTKQQAANYVNYWNQVTKDLL